MLLPGIDWPVELREAGPSFDPSIVLTGETMIGSAAYILIAVRINEFWMRPDYRQDIDEREYDHEIDDETEEALDALDYLADAANPALLALPGGQYFLWMVPAEIQSRQLI